jgi:hypothetical protein
MRTSLTIAAALVAACLAAPAADAAVTASTTTVAAPFGFADFTNLPLATRQISATTNGAPGDNVDFICRQGAATFTFAVDLPVYADGSITTDVAENRFDSRYCRLMAVPSSTPVTDFTPFAGPFVGGGELSLQHIATGPNAGTVFDHYIDQAQSKGFADYDSLGDCGLCDMQLFDSAGRSSPYLFARNARLGFPHDDGAGQMKPGATVDGKPAYAAFNAQSKAFGNAGLPPLTVTHTVDPATGDMTFQENQDLVVCNPSELSCTSFVPSQLRIERKVRQDHDGRWVRITDVVKNLDAANAHSFDFDFEQFEAASGNHLGYRLPGESGYTQHPATDGSTSAGFGPITTIGLIDDQTRPVGFDNPVGTLTVAPQPVRLLFANNGFYLDFAGTVPAGGTQTISQYYAMGESQTEIDASATAQRDELAGPSVAITSPADGATVSSTPTTVTGTATDNVGVASLTVNGAPVTVAADGSWSAPVPLNAGANTIIAVVADAAGNTDTAKRSVTYAKPSSPPVVIVTRGGKPKVRRTGRKFVLDTGLVVHCPPGLDACTTIGSAKARKPKVTFAKRTVGTAPGKAQRIVLPLTAKGVKALERSKRLAIRISLATRVGSGAATTTSRNAVVRRPTH